MIKPKADVLSLLDEVMGPEAKKKADENARQIINFLNLAEVRKKLGVRQIDVKGFSQPQVSQIEGRSDIKLSTLIEYMTSLGLNIHISGSLKEDPEQSFDLLKTG